MFISSITKQLRNAVTKYKAHKIKRAVTKYCDISALLGQDLIPVALTAYKDVAHHVVDKTFENPDVAINLLNAIDAAIKHYGPGIKDIAQFATASVDEICNGEFYKAEFETLEDYAKDLT